ncbi:MAG: chemotaxis protein CheW [Acidimicrobiales bacterium]|jgi:purine-binding chemotaxis protein CheW
MPHNTPLSGPNAASEQNSYCTFRLGELWIGIDVRRVQEVLRHDRMTVVPLAPPGVRGLINLRGQIVTALDLRSRLGLPTATDLAASVVVRVGEETFSLLMDEVGEVVRPPAEDYEPVPAGVPKRVREVVLGTFKLSDKLLLLLDLDRAVKLDHRADPAVPGTRSA